jgi:hypothetical protein
MSMRRELTTSRLVASRAPAFAAWFARAKSLAVQIAPDRVPGRDGVRIVRPFGDPRKDLLK